MTSNYKELLDICKNNFGGIAKLSMYIKGHSTAFNGYHLMSDNEANHKKIQSLIDIASDPNEIKKINYLEINEDDINEIKIRAESLVKEKNQGKRRIKYTISELLFDLKINQNFYYSVIRGDRLKDKKYYLMIEKLNG